MDNISSPTAATQPAGNTRRPTLLTLPPEIRSQIISEAVVIPENFVIDQGMQWRRRMRRNALAHGIMYEPASPIHQEAVDALIGLCLTNTQLGFEARREFYGANTFFFFDCADIQFFWSILSDTDRLLVRHISLDCPLLPSLIRVPNFTDELAISARFDEESDLVRQNVLQLRSVLTPFRNITTLTFEMTWREPHNTVHEQIGRLADPTLFPALRAVRISRKKPQNWTPLPTVRQIKGLAPGFVTADDDEMKQWNEAAQKWADTVLDGSEDAWSFQQDGWLLLCLVLDTRCTASINLFIEDTYQARKEEIAKQDRELQLVSDDETVADGKRPNDDEISPTTLVRDIQ